MEHLQEDVGDETGLSPCLGQNRLQRVILIELKKSDGLFDDLDLLKVDPSIVCDLYPLIMIGQSLKHHPEAGAEMITIRIGAVDGLDLEIGRNLTGRPMTNALHLEPI